jgi:hypothetical protein
MVTIIKCRCGNSVCNTYGLSEGMFYQGCGWPKERAQQYADAINHYDQERWILGLPSVEVYVEEPIGYVTREMAADACEPLMEGMSMYNDSTDRHDAQLSGDPYPRNGIERDDYYEELLAIDLAILNEPAI